MYNNLIFLGGIHGAGKGTIANDIAKSLPIKHLSASDILKWSELNKDQSNKKVNDIPHTQLRLIDGLNKALETNSYYLLDGHFCLFNNEGKIQEIDSFVFEKMAPVMLGVVIDDPSDIVERLGRRDGKEYDVKQLARMQDLELNQAKKISSLLNIPLVEIRNGEIDNFKKELSKIVEQ